MRALHCRQRRSLDVVSADLARSGPWSTVLRLRNAVRAAGCAGGFIERGALIAIYETEIVDGRGLSLERVLTLVRWKGPHPAPADPDAAAALLEPEAPLRAAMESEAQHCAVRRLAELRETVRARLEAQKARHLAMAATGDGSPVVGFQPGLFDRRALRRADEDGKAQLRRSADSEAQLKAIAQAASVSLAGPPRLVLAAVLDTGAGRSHEPGAI